MAKKRSKFPEVNAIENTLRVTNIGTREVKFSQPYVKEGVLQTIRMTAVTAEAKRAIADGSMQEWLKEVCKEIEKKDDGTLLLRFVEKMKRGPKPEAVKKTAKKAPGGKKRTIRKMGHRKVAKKVGERKRMPKLRLPRNTSKKEHVRIFLAFLNSDELFTAAQRAECIKIAASFAGNGGSSDKKYQDLVQKLKGKIILDPEDTTLSGDVLKALKRHSTKL